MKDINNCPNCGAPLSVGGMCDYCGTRVKLSNTLDLISNGLTDITINLRVGDEVHVYPLRGYIASTEVKYDDCFDICRSIDGTLHRVITNNPTVSFNFVGRIRKE